MDINSVPRQNKHNPPDYTDKRLVLFIEKNRCLRENHTKHINTPRPVHFRALFHIEPTNSHLYHYHHFISTVSLRHVSALSSSRSTIDTFPQQYQQNICQM
jgi:hypothetical protein